ncbi:hypothetical protein GQ457_12G006690 [Hibiscus cannabinus]
MEKEVHSTSTSMVSLLDCIHVAKAAITQIQKFSNFMDKITLILVELKILKQLENSTKEISKALNFITLASSDDMRNIIVLEKIEPGLQEGNVNICYANDLFVLISERVEIHGENMGLKNKLEEFKVEIQGSKAGIDTAEARGMEQIVELLEVGDVMPSYEEKAKRYQLERDSLGTQPLQALRSFYSSITMDVMVDPMEISSARVRRSKEMPLKGGLQILVLLTFQERIAKEDHALESIVKSLARQIKESKLALELLLLNSDDAPASRDSRELSDNLSFLDQNVIEMAKANFFKPLLHLLSSADDEQISLLEPAEDIFKLFSLISFTSPDDQLPAVQVLVQLCEINNQIVRVRTSAVKLFYCLTVDGDDISFEDHVSLRCIQTLLKIINASTDEEESSAAMGIISNLPRDIQITQWLLDSGALDIIFAFMTDGNRNALNKKHGIEDAVRALCRFTVATNKEWQKKVAEAGIIRFSESSAAMSQPFKKTRAFICCFVASETCCQVHQRICPVESSFCILEANAVEPLVRILEEGDLGACEASLDALLKLVDNERLQNGCKVLDKVNVIPPIIKLLSSTSTKLQEKALGALERIFRLPETVVDITQWNEINGCQSPCTVECSG